MLRDVLIQKGLSNRESEVACLVTKGLSNKEVANQLFVTEKTVKFHLTNIYKKMSVKSRAQLIVWCLPHLGFVEHQAELNRQDNIHAQNNAPVQGTQAAATNVIPAGSSTVGEPIQQTPIIPQGINRGNDFGSGNTGNNDAGAF